MADQHADTERLLDRIDQWHDGDDDRPLWEFLGWTREAYAAWVKGQPHVPWHEALSRPCWCGVRHESSEAFEMNAHIDGPEEVE